MRPYSLFNATANFEDYVNNTVTKKLDIFVIIYFDNIFIYIKDLD